MVDRGASLQVRSAVKALLVYQDPELPSSRIRILQMAPHLEARGISCELARWPDGIRDKLALRSRARTADVVLLQKKLPAMIDARIFSGTRLVFDYDDAIMFRDRPKNGSFESRSREVRFNRIARMSHGLIAGNRYLASFAPHDRVLIAPSPVPHEVPRRRHAVTDAIRVGWVGHSKNLSELDALRPVFSALAPRFSLTVISNEPYRGFPVTSIPWSLATQDEEVAKLDVGIMPLDTASPFTRGKCSYKLLQYFAAEVPCVASPVGMNAEVVRHGENGFLASTAEEWIDALERLASVELRAALGAAGRRDVEASYTYPALADRWAEFLRKI
jgi:glycosyltransferase involved in cell wall biosynthesis